MILILFDWVPKPRTFHVTKLSVCMVVCEVYLFLREEKKGGENVCV